MDGLRAMAEKWEEEGWSETKVGDATAWAVTRVDQQCGCFWCWLAVDAGDEGDVDCRV